MQQFRLQFESEHQPIDYCKIILFFLMDTTAVTSVDQVHVQVCNRPIQSIYFLNCTAMGLLTIIRKNRQKEKEMRLLFL